MGLDFTFKTFSDDGLQMPRWGYLGFSRFREKLAAKIGINLDVMEGFGGNLNWEGIDDPIIGLLNHSDCEGELSPEECGKIFPRLRELIAPWNEDDFDKKPAELLVSAMEHAAEEAIPLIFC